MLYLIFESSEVDLLSLGLIFLLFSSSRPSVIGWKQTNSLQLLDQSDRDQQNQHSPFPCHWVHVFDCISKLSELSEVSRHFLIQSEVKPIPTSIILVSRASTSFWSQNEILKRVALGTWMDRGSSTHCSQCLVHMLGSYIHWFEFWLVEWLDYLCPLWLVTVITLAFIFFIDTHLKTALLTIIVVVLV